MSIPEQPSDAGGRAMRDAVELLAAVLSEGELDLDRRGFYSRLAAGVAHVAGMRRVLIFHFDSVTRRVEAVGSFNMDLTPFEQADVSLETAPDAARALAEDRVIEVRPPARHGVPSEFSDLVGEHPLIYVPVGARGRWPGLIIAEPEAGSAPLDDARREWLWTVGKTLALVLVARIATFYGERAADLQQRIDLARELHEQVVQRLFGVLMALSPDGPLEDKARQRCAQEVQAALRDARAAIQRPLGRAPRATGSTLAAEIERLSHQRLDFQLRVDGPLVAVPPPLEPLVQSVFAEAVRNVRKHAHARSLVVRLRQRDGILTLEVENDGVGGGPQPPPPTRRGSAPGCAGGAAGRWAARVRRTPARPLAGPPRRARGLSMRPDAAPPRPLRVLIVDDHEVVHWGIRIMLERLPWVAGSWSARSGEEAVAIAVAREVDMALVDLFIGAESGAEISEALLAARPQMRILLISGAGQISARAAATCGASGFISKDQSAGELVRAVRAVAEGESLFEEELEPPVGPRLSAREAEVLSALAAGETNRQIAARLHLSPHTVKEYASALYRKLEVENRLQAIRRAEKLGLIG